MARRTIHALMSWLEASMAAAAHAFIRFWGRIERAYQRPFSQFAFRLKFAFYPLLAIGAIAWLAYDWSHGQSLSSAEDSIFDKVIQNRPVEPKPSGRVVIVEIDDCSIEHFQKLGEGGWPWSRQKLADLLDQLDRAGVRAVGFDLLLPDPSSKDPIGDATLEAMAEGGNGRFIFGASRVNADYDSSASAIPAAQLPDSFAISPHPQRPGPPVAILLPIGKAMALHSALLDPTRGNDGVIRDIPTREAFGDWAMPSLPLQLAVVTSHRPPQSFPASVRPNWRKQSQLPFISAANVIEGKPICRDADNAKPPTLKGSTVLVGYTASGLNDSKPTPVASATPGVEVLGEATEALINGTAVWMPPVGMKYLLAGLLVLLAAFAFYRGEPANDIDSIFVATNLLLLTLAFCGITFFGAFFDIFASVGFLSLCFGLCRMYAGVQRGRAVGNGDFRVEFDPSVDHWLVMARVRFLPYPSLDATAAARRRREYRRRLRRFLYAGCDAVMLDGIVERKSWLHATLDDLVVLVWKGPDEASARRAAARDLDALHAQFNAHDDRLDDDGTIKISVVAAGIDDGRDNSDRGERLRLREVLGRVLNAREEWPLRAENAFNAQDDPVATSRL